MSLLLINPPYQRDIAGIAQTTVGPPMGLAYLAAAAQSQGVEVSIIDANALGLDTVQTIEAALSQGAAVIGLTASTPTIHLCVAIASGLRAHGFAGAVVVGGPHPTALARETLEEFVVFDLAVRGEAEGRIAEIYRCLCQGQGLQEVPGLALRKGDDIMETGPAPSPPALDELAPPARDLLPMERYRSPDGPNAVTVIASRGCSAPCTYCAVPRHFGFRIRRRKPASVVAEIAELNREYGANWVNFIDDTFTWNKAWVCELCEELTTTGLNERVRWQCLTRVDRVSPELMVQMRQAGCARIELGIECASPVGLKALKKGIDHQQVIEAFKWARDAGLETMAFAMVNVPGETVADIAATGRLLDKARPDFLQLSYCTPYPGTPLFETALEQGRLRTTDWSDYRFLRRAVLDNGVLDETQVRREHRRLLRRFWLHPLRIASLTKRLLTEKSSRMATLKASLHGLKVLGSRSSRLG